MKLRKCRDTCKNMENMALSANVYYLVLLRSVTQIVCDLYFPSPLILTSSGQARAASDELQEEALLVARVRREDVDQHADGARLRRVAVVGADALGQHPRLPALFATT